MPIHNTISVENISFRYDGKFSPAVIDNLSFKLPKGKVTAIVGSSGSGKTTLLKVLLKIYPVSSGAIYVGDEDLSEINPIGWRNQCGTVMQDGYIFHDTILNNIVLDGNAVDKDRLDTALHIANLTAIVNELPLGLTTKIGISGMGLSGGQLQRVLIARAVYKNPNYLFFDEATSALDATNERQIMNKLHAFFEGKTVIIVAHRLSTVVNADNVIVLDKGKIVEQGTHLQLVENQGAYFRLVKNQLELSTI